MKLPALILIISLSGCAHYIPGDPPKWPAAPKELTEKCPDLNQADLNKPSITDFLKVIVSNYELYYNCSIKQEGWVNWYEEHKKNYESLKK